MRVLILSDSECAGGAAIATSRLAAGLSQQNVEVIRLVSQSEDVIRDAWTTIEVPRAPTSAIAYRASHRVSPRIARAGAAWISAGNIRGRLRTLAPDIINVHNIHDAGWTPDVVRECTRHAPTVWTMHDMWSFTGRCAYSLGCVKFRVGCDSSCPTPTEYPALPAPLIARSWLSRRRLLAENPDLRGVTPSRWLAGEAEQGGWPVDRLTVIPNGVDTSKLVAIDRREARRLLGLPENGLLALFVAQQLGDPRKGGRLLLEALDQLHATPLTLLTMGSGEFDGFTGLIPAIPLGSMDDDEAKSVAFSAADFVVHPAIADNFPNVVLEAFACGTPVVSFNVGGLPETVRPGATGWLSREISADGLAEIIREAVDDIARGVNLRDRCRMVAESEFKIDLQARRYVELFGAMLS